VKAAVVSRTAPDVPQSVLNTIQGHVRVKIRVEVDPQGKVTDATIEDLGPSHYFAAKALASARNWTFTPAQLNGHPAASTWILHFSFGPSDTTITPEETRP
jgi:TonB family protein